MRKITSVILVGMLLSMGFIGLFSITASAGYTGYITGTVTDASGAGLSYATVYYTDAFDRTSSTTTNTAGGYNLSGLAIGVYYVEASKTTYLPSSKIKVTVAADQETSNVNFVLSKSGWINGTITTSDNSATSCYAYLYDATGNQITYQSVYVSASTGGTYNFSSTLYSGTYIVAVRGYYGAALSGFLTPSRETVTVTQGQGTTKNFVLSRGGVIKGNITDQDGNLITSGLYDLYARPTGTSTSYSYTDYTNGVYNISGLTTGTYNVYASFSNCQARTYESVTVTSGQITWLNINLTRNPLAAYVCGYVKDNSGAVLSYVAYVQLMGADKTDYTDYNGFYNITSVTPGTYTIQSTYTSLPTYTGTVTVAASEGKWYNITQPSPAYITGYVKKPDGTNLTYSDCNGYTTITYKEQNQTGAGTTVNAVSDSSFNISVLASGRYTLTTKSPNTYAPASIIVDVTVDNTYVNNITTALGGYITGTVTSSDMTSYTYSGTMTAGYVFAYNETSIEWQGTTTSNSTTSSYNVSGLPTGTFRLKWYAPNVLMNDGSSTVTYLTPWAEGIAVTQGSGTVQSGATAVREGKITGNITYASTSYNGYLYLYNVYGDSTQSGYMSVSSSYTFSAFTFEELPAGTYSIKALYDNAIYGSATGIIVTANHTTYLNITITSPTGATAGTSISGYITDNSGPISGATVKARALSSTTFSTATTNATGYYQITSLSGNAYFIEATADGYCPGTIRDFIAMRGQDNTGANITLTKSATINGTITSNSEPIYGATITVYEGGAYYPTEGYTNYAVGSVSSASNGSYIYTAKFVWYYSSYSTKNMPLYLGSYRVVVTKDGYAPAQATVTITTQGETVQKNFVLASSGSIAGYVLGTNNVPVSSYIYVYARGATTGTVESAYTNSSGYYNITNLPLDDYTLSVETNGYVLATLNVSITTAGYAANQNITLVPKYYVEGYITDAGTGNPVASATVYIYKDTYTNSYVGYTNTRETGYYVLASMDSFGYYGVKITATGYITKYLPLYITSSNIVLNATLTKGSTITGSIYTNRGTLITSGSVYLKTLDGVQTDYGYVENGVYSFTSLPAGTYRLEVSSYTYGTQTPIEVTVGSAELKYQNITVTYGYLEGNVTDSLGNLIVGATVSAGGTSTTTDPNGHYLLHWTSSSNYTATANKEGYVKSTATSVQITKGATTYLNIVLAKSATISGYVTNENGQALADIYCNIETIGKTEYTNSLGYYTFNEDLNAGAYSILFTGGYYVPKSQTATVLLAGDDCLNNNVTMILGGSISGTVTNSYGGPISSVTVYAYNSTNATTYVASTSTNSNGVYNITKLVADTYTIKVVGTTIYKEKSVTSISVSSGQTTANQNMTLEYKTTVSGFVTKTIGEPVYNINIKAYNTSLSYEYYPPSDTPTISGYYNLKHLNDGTTYNIKTEGSYTYTNTLYGNATLVLGTQTTNTTQNVIMSRSANLFGYVTYNGAAVSGVDVKLFFNNTELTSSTTSTNALYFFTTNLKTGAYTVIVEKTGYAMTSQNITLTEGVATFLNISLVKSARIHGFLLDANGAPVTTETIAVYVSGQNQYLSLLPIVNDMKELGFYGISSKLIAGTYQIYATILGECVWLNVTVATGESVIANLTSTRTMGVGNITGFVKDQNGTAIAGAAVDLSGQGGFRYTDTDSNGVYTFTNITIGDYSLWAYKEGYGCGNANATVEANKTTWANITLLPYTHEFASVVGYVNGTSGSAIAGATVTLTKTGITPMIATTNATGYYEFDYAVFGLYTINATKSGYNVSSTTVNVTTQTTYYVNFTLATVVTTGTLKGFVKTTAGVAIEGVIIIMDSTTTTDTDNDGMYVFEDVAAGVHTLFTNMSAYRNATGSGTVIAGGTTWVNITMLGTTEQDTTAPTITITYPASGAVLTKTTVNITGTVSDSGGVYGVWINTVNATGEWTIACAVEAGTWYRETSAVEGTNTIYVKANDTSGNIAYASVTFIVDTIQPTIAVTSHATNIVVSTETINLVGTASDNVGLESVMISKNNETWTAATGTTTWNATVTLSVGVNTIYVKATDTSGNRLITSIKVARQEEIKTASPTTPIVVNLTVGIPYAFKLGTEQHTITVTDITNTTANVTIQSSPLTATLTIGEARLFDTNGNGQSDTSATLQSTNVTTSVANVSIISVQEDLVGPVVTISSPANNTEVKTSKAKFEGTATDSNTISKVQYSTDGTTWTDATGTTSWSFEVELKEGKNTISIRATDNHSNTGDVKSIDITYTKEKPPEPKKGWFLPGFEVLFLLAALAVVLAVRYRRK